MLPFLGCSALHRVAAEARSRFSIASTISSYAPRYTKSKSIYIRFLNFCAIREVECPEHPVSSPASPALLPSARAPPGAKSARLAPGGAANTFSRRKRQRATRFRRFHCLPRRETRQATSTAREPSPPSSLSGAKTRPTAPKLAPRRQNPPRKANPSSAKIRQATSPARNPPRPFRNSAIPPSAPEPRQTHTLTPRALESRTLAAALRDTPPRERASIGFSSPETPAR